MNNDKLIKKIFFSGEIEALTGLHIGSKNLGLSIGGVDNTVLRHPVTQQPYIPGSSLRGKMRCLIERFEGLMGDEPMSNEVKFGPFVGHKDRSQIGHYICKVFGVPAEVAKGKENEKPRPPSRLIVHDCSLIDDKRKGSVDWLKNAKHTDMPFTEVKTEVVIDRITSAAMPRQLERVPAGARFGLKMILNIWESDKDDDQKKFIAAIFDGLKLLQDDYLGGQGSRGSGRVKIHLNKLQERTFAHYQSGQAAVDRADAIPPELAAKPAEATHAGS